MAYYDRDEKILNLLTQYNSMKTEELAEHLYVSLSTLRRDLVRLEKKGLIVRTHGSAAIKMHSADEKIPFFLREQEQNSAKAQMARKAAGFVRDGYTIMLDGTTSAYAMIPYLAEFKNLIVITSSDKSSFVLGQMGINNICTGGRMIPGSLSYVGEDAQRTAAVYNADILFFSCRGISPDGMLTDNSVEENNLRRVMMSRCKKKVLLCDSSKLGKTCLHNLCHAREVDEIICEAPLPEYLLT